MTAQNHTPHQSYSNLAAMVWFAGTSFILLAACLLTAGAQRKVFLPWVGVPLPESCGSRWQFGIDCPGCGLTRCFIHAAHGDLPAAWQLHSVGLLIFIYVLLQPPLALAHWARIESKFVAMWTWCNERAIIVLAVLLVVRWLWRLASGELSVQS